MKPFTKVTRIIVFGAGVATLFFASLASAQTINTSGTVAPISAQVSIATCTTITHSLGVGSRDYYSSGDVTKLQTYLLARGYFAYQPTGYYGTLTASAVANWQRANNISAVGIVGPLTRAAIAAASCNGGVVPPQAGAPLIVSMTPTSGPVGTTIQLTGTNLTNDNTIQFGGGVILHVNAVATIGGQQVLTFVVPDALNPSCYYSNPRCMIASTQTQPGVYNVVVQNQNGTSNTIAFTVTGAQTTNAPVIYSITPTYGSIGTTVTVTGFGFAANNTIHFGSGSIANVPITSSIAIACTTNPNCHGGINQTLTFTVPQYISPYCAPGNYCALWVQQVTPGVYNLSVENTSGVSGTTTFTVTQ